MAQMSLGGDDPEPHHGETACEAMTSKLHSKFGLDSCRLVVLLKWIESRV